MSGCNMQATKPNAKINELESAVSDNPEDKFNHGLLGEQYLSEFFTTNNIKTLEKSIFHITKFVNEYPENEAGNILLYQAYLYEYLLTGKDSTFEKLNAIFIDYPSIKSTELAPPSSIKVLYMINHFDDERQLSEIKDILNKAIKENPNHPGSRILFGRVFAYEKNYDMAIASFKQAEKLSATPESVLPYSTNAWYLKTIDKLCEYENPYVDKAIDIYKEAIAKFPESAELHSELSFLYEMDGNLNLSLYEARKATQLASNAENKVILADLYLTVGQFDKAEEIYMSFLNEWTTDVSLQLAKYYFTLGDWQKTIEYTEKIKSDDETQEIYGEVLRSLSYIKLGNKNKAIKTLNKINIDPEEQEWQLNLVNYIKGNMSSEALINLSKNKCEETEAKYYSGFLEIANGNIEKGKRLYESVIALKLIPYSEYSYATQQLKEL